MILFLKGIAVTVGLPVLLVWMIGFVVYRAICVIGDQVWGAFEKSPT
jgi:hypothetical protein